MQRFKLFILFVLLGVLAPVVAQDNVTSITGIVVDADTGEPLPFVQLYFIKPTSEGSINTQYGTTSDIDGNFTLSNPVGYTTVNFQMMGYKTEMYTLRKGQQRKNIKIKLEPDVYNLQDIVVTPKHRKQEYKRKGNPAVELIKKVIAHKDSLTPRTRDHYTASTYHRQSFALDNFRPNFNKGFWHEVDFIRKYIDTTGTNPALTLSIRENMGYEYYQQKPHREKKMIDKKRFFGLESLMSTQSLEKQLQAIFKDVDINQDNINILFNRFVSPLSSTLAVAYYQYYIMDTIMVDGVSCIDLAFVPVNSESFSFTGHLYIVNDSTYKLKKYAINIPPHINLNFVSDYSVAHEYKQLPDGLWIPERTQTYCKFYLTDRKRTLQARQTKIYTDFDFDSPISKEVYSPFYGLSDSIKPADTTSIREDFQYWDDHRPEPLSFYESSVMDLVQEFKTTPKFNALLMAVDALTTEFVATVPSTRWGESKWDFGPIYNTISWNMLEGVRLRVGGTTTANLHPQFFLSSYVAYGFGDKRPKGDLTLMYSFNKKRYHQYEPLRDYLALSLNYDVQEPGQQFGIVDRDNILMSIPTGKIVMRNFQYVARARLQYYKELPIQLTTKLNFDYEYNEAAGAMTYDRILGYDTLGNISGTQRVKAYHNYEFGAELKYSPGADFPINRMGVETPFTLEQDAPVISIRHTIGYLDDRNSGGRGYFYNATQLTAEKRFWFSSFGHLDARIQTGMVWNKVPFTKLYSPTTSTSIFLGKNAFNLMQPMEFIMDEYVALYATYFFKGWILNRIPGINRLKLRGVVSFSGIYGGLTAKNNPYKAGNEGLYKLPDSSTFDSNGEYISGYTSSPIGKLPYMEFTAGFENILKFIRIDYVRRITYNDYQLPNGNRRKIGAWGRNGVKITVRFAL
ncbi:MAG: carboxypeptidase-like regulatory domain-containing protein [Paludibacteraceae bacterium]|nr:carboxypeptidase-like regulatory domain-containing protein [Paludibacteraceae bacterium]